MWKEITNIPENTAVLWSWEHQPLSTTLHALNDLGNRGFPRLWQLTPSFPHNKKRDVPWNTNLFRGRTGFLFTSASGRIYAGKIGVSGCLGLPITVVCRHWRLQPESPSHTRRLNQTRYPPNMDKECLFISEQPPAVSTYCTVGLPNRPFPTEKTQRIIKERKTNCYFNWGDCKRDKCRFPDLIYNRNVSNWKTTNIPTNSQYS
jgi:hypothetical protein